MDDDGIAGVDLGRRRELPASSTEDEQAEGRAGGWCASSVRRHPSTDVVQVSCKITKQGRSCPVGTTAENHWIRRINMLSHDISSITVGRKAI